MTWPQPDTATLGTYYAAGEYRTEEGKRFVAPVEWLFELQKKRYFTALAGTADSGRMVDIGCGSGFTASLFAKNGWTVTGVEFSDETASHARETYHIDVVTSVSSLEGPFDLILVNHVLEHFYEPEQVLFDCRRLLAPAGRLVVAVPNFDSLQSRFGREYWFHRDLPIHLFHFSEKGLASLLAKSGFDIIARSHADWPQNFYGWLQTLLNRMGLKRNALYDFLRLRDRSAKKTLTSSVIISLIMCIVAVPTAFLAVLVEKIFRTGGVIRFTAVGTGAISLQEDGNRAQ